MTYIKTAREPYVTLRSFPHYGEHGVVTGKGIDGKIEVILMDCRLHKAHKIWITRQDLG